MTGNEILAKSLRRFGVDVLFFLMGGPMVDCENACEAEGIRMIDVRHEQAAAMMGHAYARMARRPAVCMAASGPGTLNLVTGIATAWADGAPLIAIGGSQSVPNLGMEQFQETDQVAVMKPITRWADRCYATARIPEFVATAFRMAFGARPGPVYLDMPGDVLYKDIPEDAVQWCEPQERTRPQADPAAVETALRLIEKASRPLIISGSGVIWSGAEAALQLLVERAGIPFWSTPQGRGVIPEDHRLSFLGARSIAFKETDLIIEVGTRQNYVIDYARPPRWNADARLIQIDIDPGEIGRHRPADAGLAGDARAVLEQMLEGASLRLRSDRYAAWTDYLNEVNQTKMTNATAKQDTSARPIHPLRLCREVSETLPRNAVLVVDGQEILTFARQSIPFYTPHSLNSGPYGCMGVGLPFALGAKVALPDHPVIVLHGDGSFGLNAMEMDTAVRHDLAVVCVISNNAGWTASDRHKVGRDLGFTRYDQMFAPLGVHTEFVEDPLRIRPALEAALASGKPALINVITDPKARAVAGAFTNYRT